MTVRLRYYYEMPDGFAAEPPVDPLPQIREAFPEVARRLDALDEIERIADTRFLSRVGETDGQLRRQIANIIREAKR